MMQGPELYELSLNEPRVMPMHPELIAKMSISIAGTSRYKSSGHRLEKRVGNPYISRGKKLISIVSSGL